MRQRHPILLTLGFIAALACAEHAAAADSQVSIGDAQAAEGNAGTTPLGFSVNRTGDAAGNLVVEYETADADTGSATGGEDYTAARPGSQLRLPPGVGSRVINIDVLGDTAGEGNETFLVRLTRAMAYGAGPEFGPAQTLAVGANPVSVAAGDMNGDGRNDLVTADHDAHSLSLLLGQAGGGFAAAQPIAPGLGPRGHAIGDLNADGRPDIVVPLEPEDRVLIVPNGGGLDFSGAHVIDIAGGPYAAAIGDLDGDGRPEVVVAESGSRQIAVLRNISSGGAVGFETVRHITVGSFPHSVAIGDLDGDGFGDIAVVNSGDNNVSLLRGSSGMALDGMQTLAAGAGAEAVAIGDLDGDGKPDLAVANAYGDDVSVLRNASTPGVTVFEPARHFAAADAPYSIAVADLDGDGKPEIAVSANGADSAAVLPNTSSSGQPSFGSPRDLPAGDGPYAIASSDLDGDGKPDLAIANASSNSVSVLRNSPNLTASFGDNEGVGTIIDDDDNSPNPFQFTDRQGVRRSEVVVSNAVQITGLSRPAPVSVAGGSYSIGCTASFTTAPGAIANGQTVCVRHVASSQYGTRTNTTLTVGGASDTFTSTTQSAAEQWFPRPR